jgi:hypothetical protein
LSLPFFITAYVLIEYFVRTRYGIAKPNSAYITAVPSLIVGLISAWGIVRLQERRQARKAQAEKRRGAAS